jgi:biotin transport system substrate-specific component
MGVPMNAETTEHPLLGGYLERTTAPSVEKVTEARNIFLIFCGSCAIAVAAQLSFVLPNTPVPFSMVNVAVLTVGILLGPRLGMWAAMLYLFEGTVGFPVFSASGVGGVLRLLGPSGGYLLSFPLSAFLAGWIVTRLDRGFVGTLVGAAVGNLFIFAVGVSWLLFDRVATVGTVLGLGLQPFGYVELVKIVGVAMLCSVRGKGKSSLICQTPGNGRLTRRI